MLAPSPRVFCLGWWEVSHWQLVLTAPAAPAKSLRHLRGRAATSCPSCLLSPGRGSMREAKPIAHGSTLELLQREEGHRGQWEVQRGVHRLRPDVHSWSCFSGPRSAVGEGRMGSG